MPYLGITVEAPIGIILASLDLTHDTEIIEVVDTIVIEIFIDMDLNHVQAIVVQVMAIAQGFTRVANELMTLIFDKLDNSCQ